MTALSRHAGNGAGRAARPGDAAPDPWALLRSLPDLVVVLDGQANLVWANDRAERWSGWALSEMVGQPMHDLAHPDDLHTALVSLGSVQAKEVGTLIELRLKDRSGTYSRFEVRGRATEIGVVLGLRDVTDRRRWEVAAGGTSLLQAVLDAAPAITMVLDRDGSIRGASRALTSILGHDLETALGRRLAALASDEHREAVGAALAASVATAGSTTFEAAFPCLHTGGDVPLSITVVNLLDDRAVEGLVVTAVDVTTLADARDELEHLAGHDQLTGLPNRSLLFDRLDQALARSTRAGSAVSVIYGDLDGFKEVNDAFGHAAGDHVLVTVAARLLAVARASDTVARIGGDEFVLVTESVEGDGSTALASRLSEVVRAPIDLPGGGAVTVTMCTGAAVSLGGSISADELLGAADAAMYRVKHRGG